MEELEELFQDLGIPDRILEEFDKQYHITDLIKTNDDTRKCFYFYKFNGLTYWATLYNYYFGPENERQFTIKLSHDGFRYSKRKFTRSNICWHNSNSFFILDPDVLKELPFVKSLKEKLGATVILYYSIGDKQMDIRFKKDGKHFLMVTFESRKPEFIADDELYI